MIIKLRVFYRKSDSQIVWTSSLDGTGEFPRSIEQELELLPETKIYYSMDGFNLLGGIPSDYACIEETDPDRIAGILASDTNTIVNGELIIGEPRPEPPPPPPPEHHSFSPSFQPLDLPGIAQRVDYIETFLKALYP